MISVKGIFNGNNVEFKHNLNLNKRYNVIVTFIDECDNEINDEIRNFGENNSGFEFWMDERENLYKDYLGKIE
jgi:hypothetical protein